MAEHRTANWTIFYIVVDEKNPFSVEIQPDTTIHGLKKAIKEEQRPKFDRFDANNLTLFKVDIPDDDNLEENVNQFLVTKPKALRVTWELSDYYETTPPEEMVHILVQPPENSK